MILQLLLAMFAVWIQPQQPVITYLHEENRRCINFSIH